MTCPACGGETVAFAVPEEYRPFVDGEATAALCTRCLSSCSAESVPENPDFEAVSEAFPSGAAAIPMALAVGLLDSLALHRDAVETLLRRVERAGTDPLLVLDRLADDPNLDPAADLAARRRQVTQFRD